MAIASKEKILSTLETLFPDPKPSLHGWATPFQFLVAVLLSGNSTDKAVNKILPQLFAVVPDPVTMSQISHKELYSLIRSCGLGERKATSLIEISKILISDYQGVLPQSLEALEALPGIGRKTASVFLSVLYNQPTFPVDTHIFRLATRWGITNKKTPLGAEKDLSQFFAGYITPQLHLRLIYFARTFCPAKKHNTSSCPICSLKNLKDLL